MAVSIWASLARAQHASENPILSADDAFGLTLGTETIGIYGPGGVRGFSPQAAGNARIDGLYFDQQGLLSSRVIEGSTIRVGLSAIGYAFPAPTGLVDYDLRRPGGNQPIATLIVGAGPAENRSFSIDGASPFCRTRCSCRSVRAARLRQPFPGTPPESQMSAPLPSGYPMIGSRSGHSSIGNKRAMPRLCRSSLRRPTFYRPHGSRYRGQDWAKGKSLSENYGGIVHATLSQRWSLAAGIFRSISDAPASYADLYVDTQPSGSALHELVGSPDQTAASTSGEVRLTGQFSEGPLLSRYCRSSLAVATHGTLRRSDVVMWALRSYRRRDQFLSTCITYSARTLRSYRAHESMCAYHGRWPGIR